MLMYENASNKVVVHTMSFHMFKSHIKLFGLLVNHFIHLKF